MTTNDALNLSASPSSPAYRPDQHPDSPADVILSRPSSQEGNSFNDFDSGNEVQGIYSDDNGGYNLVTPAGSPYRIKTPKNVQSYSPPTNIYQYEPSIIFFDRRYSSLLLLFFFF